MPDASRDNYIAVSGTDSLKARNQDATSICSSSYASSTENISRLLEGWMRSSPNANNTNIVAMATVKDNQAKDLESLLSFENLGSIADWEKLNSESTPHEILDEGKEKMQNEQPPMSFLEKWLLDEAAGHVDELMDVPADCCSNTAAMII